MVTLDLVVGSVELGEISELRCNISILNLEPVSRDSDELGQTLFHIWNL